MLKSIDYNLWYLFSFINVITFLTSCDNLQGWPQGCDHKHVNYEIVVVFHLVICDSKGEHKDSNIDFKTAHQRTLSYNGTNKNSNVVEAELKSCQSVVKYCGSG